MPEIASTFDWAGGGKTGAAMNAWMATRFSTTPAMGSLGPDENPPDAGPVESGPGFGSPGAFILDVPEPGDYWVSGTYGGVTFWQLYPGVGDSGGGSVDFNFQPGRNVTVNESIVGGGTNVSIDFEGPIPVLVVTAESPYDVGNGWSAPECDATNGPIALVSGTPMEGDICTATKTDATTNVVTMPDGLTTITSQNYVVSQKFDGTTWMSFSGWPIVGAAQLTPMTLAYNGGSSFSVLALTPASWSGSGTAGAIVSSGTFPGVVHPTLAIMNIAAGVVEEVTLVTYNGEISHFNASAVAQLITVGALNIAGDQSVLDATGFDEFKMQLASFGFVTSGSPGNTPNSINATQGMVVPDINGSLWVCTTSYNPSVPSNAAWNNAGISTPALPVIYGSTYGMSTSATDNGPALTNACNAAIASSGTRIVYPGPGTFNFQSALNVTNVNGLQILGAAPTAHANAPTIFSCSSGFTGSLINFTYCNGIRFTDIEITSAGTGLNQTGITETACGCNVYPTIAVTGLQNGIIVQGGTVSGGLASHGKWGQVFINLPTASVANCVGMTFQNGTLGDSHHHEVDHMEVNFGGGTNPAIAMNMRGCDSIHTGFLQTANGFAGCLGIQGDFTQASKQPAGCVWDVVDFDTATGTTAIGYTGTPSAGPSGVIDYNVIVNTLTNNGVPPTSSVPNFIASFNEPHFAAVVQPGTITSGSNIVNTNPYAVMAYVQYPPQSGSIGTGYTCTVTLQGTLVNTLYANASGSTSSFGDGWSGRIPMGQHFVLTWTGTVTPTVVFEYCA